MITDFELFIDSDGVVADFDKKALELCGAPISQLPKGRLWQAVEEYNRHTPFFESLDKMHDADELIDYARKRFVKVAILTASGYTPKDGAEQKRRWYEKHWPGLTVHVVEKSPDKAAFAKLGRCILIDDRLKSLDPWCAAGGIAVLHTSTATTIEQIEKIIATLS